jgi:predicted DNA-binding protein
MSDLLVNQLWESDEASALTNQAARRIEELEDKLAKAVEALDRIQDGSYGKLAAKARTTLAELKGEDQG